MTPVAAAKRQQAKAVVLIVEDDRDNREGLAEYLGALGFTIAVADDGHQALATATTLLPDLILMDLKLRGVDGWEVTRRICLRLSGGHRRGETCRLRGIRPQAVRPAGSHASDRTSAGAWGCWPALGRRRKVLTKVSRSIDLRDGEPSHAI